LKTPAINRRFGCVSPKTSTARSQLGHERLSVRRPDITLRPFGRRSLQPACRWDGGSCRKTVDVPTTRMTKTAFLGLIDDQRIRNGGTEGTFPTSRSATTDFTSYARNRFFFLFRNGRTPTAAADVSRCDLGPRRPEQAPSSYPLEHSRCGWVRVALGGPRSGHLPYRARSEVRFFGTLRQSLPPAQFGFVG